MVPKSYLLLSLIFLIVVADYLVEGKEKNGDVSWEWGSRAKKLCQKELGKLEKKGICTVLQEVVEESFDIMGDNMLNIIGEASWTDLRERSSQQPWKGAGIHMINEIIDQIKTGKLKKEEDIKNQFQGRFSGWLLKVAAGDKNNVMPTPDFDPSNPEAMKKFSQSFSKNQPDDESEKEEL